MFGLPPDQETALRAKFGAFFQYFEDTIGGECHLAPGEDGRVGVVSNTPGDAGGWTKYGITLNSLSEFRETRCTPEDIQNLTIDEACEVYYTNFWVAPHFNRLPESVLTEEVFDSAVGTGPAQTIKFLQRALAAQGFYSGAIDGQIAAPPAPSGTVAGVQGYISSLGQKALIEAFTAQRDTFMTMLAETNPQDAQFLKGWLWRDHMFDAKAQTL